MQRGEGYSRQGMQERRWGHLEANEYSRGLSGQRQEMVMGWPGRLG